MTAYAFSHDAIRHAATGAVYPFVDAAVAGAVVMALNSTTPDEVRTRAQALARISRMVETVAQKRLAEHAEAARAVRALHIAAKVDEVYAFIDTMTRRHGVAPAMRTWCVHCGVEIGWSSLRIAETLVRDGKLQRVQIPGERARYVPSWAVEAVTK